MLTSKRTHVVHLFSSGVQSGGIAGNGGGARGGGARKEEDKVVGGTGKGWKAWWNGGGDGGSGGGGRPQRGNKWGVFWLSVAGAIVGLLVAGIVYMLYSILQYVLGVYVYYVYTRDRGALVFRYDVCDSLIVMMICF